MKGSIVGCARDCGVFLPNALTTALQLSSHFDVCDFIFFENDSEDDTLQLLKHFCEQDPAHRKVISEIGVTGHRENRLAHGRKTVMSAALASSPQVVIVMDMDDVNQEVVDFETALRFVVNGTLSVAVPTQKQYYDLWALRTGREPERCRHLPAAATCQLGRDFKLDERRWISLLSFNRLRQLRNSSNRPFVEVVSAFGGLGIYDADVAARSVHAYSGTTVNGFKVCEHVPFHEHIVATGGKVGIVTSFTNTGWDFKITSAATRITAIVLACLFSFVFLVKLF